METQKPLLKDEDGEEVDFHLYRSMTGSLMYLTSLRPDIMYLNGQLKLGLWYPKDLPFDLVAYTDSDYARASLDRKSTIGDSNEKKLIQMIKMHTNKNVADLLTKSFDTKSAKSKGFEQMVDFLNASSIRYALTVNPTIYTSYIEQFWAIVKVKTVNGEQQLQALVDGKKIIIIEAPVRRDLQVEDADGDDCLPNAIIFEQLTLMGIYIAPSYTKKIFAIMRRQGKDFFGRETPLFPTMVVQAQEEIGEGLAMPTDPHHTPIITQPSSSQP
ncbi:hypothetical protein Tco_1432819 [Tanacetum coccineum]